MLPETPTSGTKSPTFGKEFERRCTPTIRFKRFFLSKVKGSAARFLLLLCLVEAAPLIKCFNNAPRQGVGGRPWGPWVVQLENLGTWERSEPIMQGTGCESWRGLEIRSFWKPDKAVVERSTILHTRSLMKFCWPSRDRRSTLHPHRRRDWRSPSISKIWRRSIVCFWEVPDKKGRVLSWTWRDEQIEGHFGWSPCQGLADLILLLLHH